MFYNNEILFCFRTLLFRIKTLSKHQIKLVFVLDGKIPELKINTVLKRLGTEK